MRLSETPSMTYYRKKFAWSCRMFARIFLQNHARLIIARILVLQAWSRKNSCSCKNPFETMQDAPLDVYLVNSQLSDCHPTYFSKEHRMTIADFRFCWLCVWNWVCVFFCCQFYHWSSLHTSSLLFLRIFPPLPFNKTSCGHLCSLCSCVNADQAKW